MADKLFEVTKIRENVLHIADAEGVYFTIVKGQKEAIVWDTGYGFADIKQFVEQIVTTPYKVLLSHGHPDHIGGSVYFDEVYLAPEDDALYREDLKEIYRKEALAKAMQEKVVGEEAIKALKNKTIPRIKKLQV